MSQQTTISATGTRETPPSETPAIDARRHLSLSALEQAFERLPSAPADSGRVVLLVERLGDGERSRAASVQVSPELGFPGDRWARVRSAYEPRFGKRYDEMQIATMQASVAELIANGQPLTLFGDNLLLDLDLSNDNLPIGSRLCIGNARFEVTPFPHTGCAKFQARFGPDALRYISDKGRRNLNLRGIYLRALEHGQISVGDKAEVLFRP